MKAIIGITTSFTSQDQVGRKLHIGTIGQSYHLLANDYVQAVAQAGAIPMLIPKLESDAERRELLQVLDGIVFSGGADISPEFYGEKPLPECGEPVVAQDRHDLALARMAVEIGLPILGICRGLQTLNVALGGSLYQDLPSQVPESKVVHDPTDYVRSDPQHGVELAGDSDLARIFGATSFGVNSFHHQAVKVPAPSLRVVGRSEDGMVEAMEGKDQPTLWLVQWHPEMMASAHPSQERIFSFLVRAAEEN